MTAAALNTPPDEDETDSCRIRTVCTRRRRDGSVSSTAVHFPGPDWDVYHIHIKGFGFDWVLQFSVIRSGVSRDMHFFVMPSAPEEDSFVDAPQCVDPAVFHLVADELHLCLARLIIYDPRIADRSLAAATSEWDTPGMMDLHGMVFMALVRARKTAARVNGIATDFAHLARKYRATMKVVRAIEEAYCDPRTELCKRRLMREWRELSSPLQ